VKRYDRNQNPGFRATKRIVAHPAEDQGENAAEQRDIQKI
jgi:hypothetical protein